MTRPEANPMEDRNPKGTLLLSRSQVRDLLSLDECIDAVGFGFRSQYEEGVIPAGVLSASAPGGAFHVKAAGLRRKRSYFAAKLNGNFDDNARRGLPRIQGLIVLCDATTGSPLAVMDSTEITILRTGAATGVAARYLARPDSSVLTICGCGLQGRVQARAVSRVRPIRRVYAVDSELEAARRFSTEIGTDPGLEVEVVSDLRDAARRSDICVTCTPSHRPLLGRDDVAPGTFVAAVGADSEDKQELEPALVAAATLVVDHLEQCATIGELHHALEAGLMTLADVHGSLQEVITGRRAARRSDDEVIVFDSTGVAHQDVAAASLAFEKAVRLGVGSWAALLS